MCSEAAFRWKAVFSSFFFYFYYLHAKARVLWEYYKRDFYM